MANPNINENVTGRDGWLILKCLWTFVVNEGAKPVEERGPDLDDCRLIIRTRWPAETADHLYETYGVGPGSLLFENAT